MTKLADLHSILDNARKVLGKPNSLGWQVFNQVNGNRTGPDIAKIINKKPENVTLKLIYLKDMGLLEENGKVGKAVIYKKISELKTLKPTKRALVKPAKNNAKSENESSKENAQKQSGFGSKVIQQIVEQGKKIGIENIDQNWIDALVILNFIETATTKFLMDHGYDETQVKGMKWDAKLSSLQGELFKEAKAKNYTIRTTSISFFRNYRDVRNDQDHVAHLPSSHITNTDLQLLKNNLKVFISTAFTEHKKYCPIT